MNSEKWLPPVSMSPVQVPIAPTSSWGSPRSARGSNPGPFQITSALGLGACEILCVPFKNTVCLPHPCGSAESNPHWLSRPHLPGAEPWARGFSTDSDSPLLEENLCSYNYPPICGLPVWEYGSWLYSVPTPPTHLSVIPLYFQLWKIFSASLSPQVIFTDSCSVNSCNLVGPRG